MRLPSILSSSVDLQRTCFPRSPNVSLSSPNLEWVETCWRSSGWSHSSEQLCSATLFILFQPCLGSRVIISVCESIFRRMGSNECAESRGSAGDKGRVAWHGRPG